MKRLLMTVAAMSMIANAAQAAEVQVKMLNKDGKGGMMIFEPALVHVNPGDTVHFVAVDKGHNVQLIKGMAPEGFAPVAGKMNEDLTVKLDKEGVYGFECLPHYGMGMVALIVAGKPVNEDAVKTISQPGFAKKSFEKLFGELDAKK